MHNRNICRFDPGRGYVAATGRLAEIPGASRSGDTRRLAARSRDSGTHEMRIFPPQLTIQHRLSVQRAHRPAGRFQHRLRRGGIPLHGAAEAWIQIRDPLRQAAKFQAGAKIHRLRHDPAGEIRLQPRGVPVMAAGENDWLRPCYAFLRLGLGPGLCPAAGFLLASIRPDSALAPRAKMGSMEPSRILFSRR